MLKNVAKYDPNFQIPHRMCINLICDLTRGRNLNYRTGSVLIGFKIRGPSQSPESDAQIQVLMQTHFRPCQDLKLSTFQLFQLTTFQHFQVLQPTTFQPFLDCQHFNFHLLNFLKLNLRICILQGKLKW